MSIVVLTSRGQDPAEFENHFSRGLKLPKNAEICLCGSQLTRADPLQGITVAGSNNDGFIIVYGSPNYGAYAPYGSYRIKIKPGIFTPTALASQIINALAVGNYNKDFQFGNFSDIPVSPLRLGLFCAYDSATEKMKFSVDRNYVNSVAELDADFIGKKFVVSCGQDLGGSPGTIPGNIIDAQLTTSQLDRRYATFYPTAEANSLLKTDVLWNGSNGAAPLQPTDPAVAVFGTTVPDSIIPAYQQGWRWGCLLDESVDRNYVLGMCGGIIQSRKVWNETTHTGYDIRDEAANQHDLRLDWSVGGAKWDLWWEVERFVPAQAAPGTFQIGVYYHPIPKAWTGNEVWDRSNAVKVGEGRWAIGPAGTPTYNEVVFRPVDGTLGTAASPYRVSTPADQNKCCIDFATNIVDPSLLPSGTPVPGSFRPMTGSGQPGYVAVSDEGQFDLYKHAPLYMGYSHRNNSYIPVDPSQIGAISLQGIEHASKTNQIASMSQINYAEWVDTVANVANANFSFQPITFAFSPLTENQNSFARPMVEAASQRYSNIAGAIGFIERKTHTLTSANSTTGLSSDFASSAWSPPSPLAIIQLPNIGIDGDLGGGNTVWGGAVSANILGVVPTVNKESDATRREVFHEPANENWIKVKNLGSDSLDQIKVKITDNTGKKLTGLTPDSSIWIKIKCGSDGKNMTLEKRGAVFPNERAPTMIDSAYRNY